MDLELILADMGPSSSSSKVTVHCSLLIGYRAGDKIPHRTPTNRTFRHGVEIGATGFGKKSNSTSINWQV